MDLAYDHIVEESLPKEEDGKRNKTNGSAEQTQNSLNAEFQDAYKAFSASPWGAKLGGFFGNVVKQGETVYQGAQKELTAVGSEAQRGFTGLTNAVISRTRGLSLAGGAEAEDASEQQQQQQQQQEDEGNSGEKSKELTTDEAIKESENVLSRLRSEAAKRLKDIQRAEDAADEALLRFGTNISAFLRDAVSIAPPSGGADGNSNNNGQGGDSTVLFESKDAAGKRVIHTSRFDAQLHVIHTSTESFTKDPATGDWDTWGAEFDIKSKTEDISRDLDKYPELRATMEKLVPETIPYEDFWKRYYFLRHGIDLAEARRKELLKAASAEEEVGWDEDSDDEAAAAPGSSKADEPKRPGSTGSSTTIHPPTKPAEKPSTLLKPNESRKSNDERSQPDSETSYDMVGAASGVPSNAPNSPREGRKADDDSDEDWE
ncbi:putative bsd domain-containing protein [Diaporthe ampelina]|uniref:Putative bsd domain-containing protein n=1 Tax=Diaporthe ampelina TaxID=1214573 RepID=A0A0G2FUU1_9PEZI|nr:putative bsd domain-containing protein [Diaporthe ampelina]